MSAPLRSGPARDFSFRQRLPAGAIRIIEPEEDVAETLEFDPAKIRAAIDAGRRAVDREWDALEPLLS